ncbi:hypothetical protein Barb6_00164 [Bacteroidales bacterium Barb6]|nr:hypothetical protein Barb6_00164 [Bacteroidales bacterium Barb6]
METKKRFVEYLKARGIGQTDFESKVGFSRGQIAQKNGFTASSLNKIAEYFPELNMNWLITGKGDSQVIGDISSSTVVGSNVNGNGNSITHNEMDRMIDLQEKYIERLKKRDEQIDKLLDIINNMNKNK